MDPKGQFGEICNRLKSISIFQRWKEGHNLPRQKANGNQEILRIELNCLNPEVSSVNEKSAGICC